MPPAVKVAHITTVDMTLGLLLFNQLKALQRHGYAVAAVSRPGPWVRKLQACGIAHHAIPSLTRRWTPLADLRAVWDLVALFRREQFTIVHTHTPKSGVLGRWAARLARVPIVVNTVHGIYGIQPGHPFGWFFAMMERLAARLSDFEFSQSREIFDGLIASGVLDPNRSLHLGNGVDLEHFHPAAVTESALHALRAELGIPPGATVVGTVGRLVYEKGYREFAAAAEHVMDTWPDVRFIAVGPHDHEKSDSLTADEIRHAEASGIRFLGMRTDIREMYALMDIFVLASYREGFPRSAIEAAAMGKPLILTDISGCREVVTDGSGGLLVPARQVEPLIQAIGRLVTDADLRQRMGAESRRRAVAEFDEGQVIHKIVNVYRQLLTEKRWRGMHVDQESPAR